LLRSAHRQYWFSLCQYPKLQNQRTFLFQCFLFLFPRSSRMPPRWSFLLTFLPVSARFPFETRLQEILSDLFVQLQHKTCTWGLYFPPENLCPTQPFQLLSANLYMHKHTSRALLPAGLLPSTYRKWRELAE